MASSVNFIVIDLFVQYARRSLDFDRSKTPPKLQNHARIGTSTSTVLYIPASFSATTKACRMPTSLGIWNLKRLINQGRKPLIRSRHHKQETTIPNQPSSCVTTLQVVIRFFPESLNFTSVPSLCDNRLLSLVIGCFLTTYTKAFAQFTISIRTTS